MNVVCIVGNLAADPEIRVTQSGKSVAHLRVAVNSKQGAEFIPVVAWGATAEMAQKYLTKGRKVGVRGRLHINKWQDEQGNTRSRMEVISDNIEFLDSKVPEGAAQEASEIEPEDFEFEE